jgi:hypothetical protein
MTSLHDQIAALSDDEAKRVLALALDGIGRPVDAFAARDAERHLREALAQPDVAAQAAPDPSATAGGLTREALRHLADENEAIVARALTMTHERTRFDPATLAVGALVLFAFRSEIELERDPERGWTFRFKTKPLGDETVGKLLGQLMGVFTSPQP